ncbi:UvrB/UvrC motif-containing protein [Sphingobium sp.]|uniref:UvrB/UvrC motif-containing protein n=1 Tax=Sphingobium sp. TaxID=1912891 RepID=UPI002C0D9574|nr:UvrB/UvrC motif-containing protein [Sphingobium sp.]HUD93691.1 UvrB/UvrC motif-containing protein [Sphingobium sp.]
MARHEEQLPDLQRAMHDAAAKGDFEKAAKLRDKISLLRGMSVGEPAQDFDPSGLVRQRPGAMGLGTGRQHVKPPSGWKPPNKPDPMTKGRRRGRQSRD